MLSGLRRIGKTTLLKQLVGELLRGDINPANILMFSYDNENLIGLDLISIVKLYLKKMKPEGIYYILIDEIQYLGSWSLWMKNLYDRYDEARMIATGSASLLLEKGGVESGLGR